MQGVGGRGFKKEEGTGLHMALLMLMLLLLHVTLMPLWSTSSQ